MLAPPNDEWDNPSGATFSWRDLAYKIPIKGEGEKTLLHPQSGFVAAGSMLAGTLPSPPSPPPLPSPLSPQKARNKFSFPHTNNKKEKRKNW